MKCICDRAALLEALNAAAGVIPVRTPKPILECVRFTAHKDHVVLTAYDQEVGLRYRVMQVDVSRSGDVLMPGKRFHEIVRESPDETLAIEAEADVVHIRGADSHFEVLGQNPREFPPVPDAEGDALFSVQVGPLVKAIGQTLFAAAKENTRYAINGVLWEPKGDRLRMVSTDGRRLALSTAPLAGGPAAKEDAPRAIVPLKALNLLTRLHLGAEDLVEVHLSSNQIIFRTDHAVVSSLLVEGHFPKYEDVLPRDHDKSITLDTAEFLSAVHRAGLFSAVESRGVKLTFNQDGLVLSGRTPEQGEATVRLAVDYAGPELTICFNPEYLEPALKVAEEKVTLELKDHARPGVLKSGSDFLYVLMPVNLS